MEKRNTQQEFISAFWNFYALKPIEKISINQLCHSAGYNRSTFYNHFRDIYELQDIAVDEIVAPVKAKISVLKELQMILQGNLAETILFPYFLKKDRYIELLFKRHADYLLSDKIKENIFSLIKEQLRDKTVDFDMIEIIVEYQLSAAFGVLNYWYQHGKTISAGNLLNKIFTISSKGAYNVLKGELDRAGLT